jgi:hypothetical protein
MDLEEKEELDILKLHFTHKLLKMDTEESTEPKQLSFPEFLDKSFEALFNQNNLLHHGLQAYLKSNVEDKLDEMKKQIEEHQQVTENAIIDFTRKIIEGLDKANEELYLRLTSK